MISQLINLSIMEYAENNHYKVMAFIEQYLVSVGITDTELLAKINDKLIEYEKTEGKKTVSSFINFCGDKEIAGSLKLLTQGQELEIFDGVKTEKIKRTDLENQLILFIHNNF